MLFTFIFEFVSALYILLTSRLKPSTILLVLILLCLGIFQLAEYQVCRSSSTLWMRVGFVATTLLPPLGVHLVSLVSKKPWYRYAGYGFAFIFMATFIMQSNSIQTAICGGNYIMVTTANSIIYESYPIYYFLVLALGLFNIAEALRWQKLESTRDSLKSSYLFWIGIGYASFLIPSGFVYLISEPARRGLPSIMCGFAVILAIILAFKVFPISKKLEV